MLDLAAGKMGLVSYSGFGASKLSRPVRLRTCCGASVLHAASCWAQALSRSAACKHSAVVGAARSSPLVHFKQPYTKPATAGPRQSSLLKG